MEATYQYDKDKIKTELSIDQVFDLVAELGGEPRMVADGNLFVSRTICHGGHSHKLYYYENTHLFKCFTECSPDIFDIYELVRKVKSQNSTEWELPQAIQFVANYYGIFAVANDFGKDQEKLNDWQILNNYDKIGSNSDNEKQTVELKIYDKKVLQYFPHPRIEPWEKEGITREVMESRGICYNPSSDAIIIPHYNIDGELIGIRERTLIKEEEIYGKYKPASFNGKMYNHPLGFNLYNLNFSKDNIKAFKKAIIFEGEKGPMLYASYFGIENDISVAVCGSSLIKYQVDLLLSLGVQEIIIAFDKQFQESGDDEYKRWTKKLTDLHKKYSPMCQISFMFDKSGEYLGYKDSPIDKGPETFLTMFKERIRL